MDILYNYGIDAWFARRGRCEKMNLICVLTVGVVATVAVVELNNRAKKQSKHRPNKKG